MAGARSAQRTPRPPTRRARRPTLPPGGAFPLSLPGAFLQALEKYSRDLTAEAKAGRLDPVIGRDDEVRRAMTVLSRRTKNNPILLGEPGRVGKGRSDRAVDGRIDPSIRRAGCGQDGDRRGPRAAHRRGRRARELARPQAARAVGGGERRVASFSPFLLGAAGCSRWTWARSSRAQSTEARSKAARGGVVWAALRHASSCGQASSRRGSRRC